jgi:hypothetical protein
MYNIDCASSILLSFIRTTCLKDIDDYCKQKSVQLAIELDTLQKQLQNPSRNIGNISSTPSNGNPANDVEHDLHKKKEIIEKQLKAINTASKSLKGQYSY